MMVTPYVFQSTVAYIKRVHPARGGVNSLIEHERSTERRAYRKTKRAEDEMLTKARIVDAAEALHGTLGPARTTVSAIADRAGVTRATVYRHFPDDQSLFVACSTQWMSRQRLPDPDAWTAHDDPLARLHEGLADIYRYYRAGEQMITLVHRDAEAVPPRVAAVQVAAERRWLGALLQPFPGRRRKAVRAAVAHAAAFHTWRSLCVDQGLSNGSAVDLMVGMVAVACGS
jgi:AcrR family transcriptional regulator